MKQPIGLLAVGLAASLAGTPLAYLLSLGEFSDIEIGLALINGLGWSLFGIHIWLGRQLQSVLVKFSELFGFSPRGATLSIELTDVLHEVERWYRASYAFHLTHSVDGRDLGARLRHVVQLAYADLNANAVQLFLFDNESGRTSQTMTMGYPSGYGAEESVVTAENSQEQSVKNRDDVIIVDQPVSFAGTIFGRLIVEFDLERQLSQSELRTIYLLSTQGALLLIDAHFADELIRMRRMSQESIEAKTGFLANLSHEIRGPLGVVINGIELVQDGYCGEITKEQKETLGMVRKSCDHLLDLVNDVLDYAKVESGKVIPKKADVQLAPLLKDLSNIARSQAIQKKQKVSLVSVDKTLGVSCDKRHLRQMLINILTNAVKYTPEGGEISIWAERVPGGKARISVRDSGIGIPEAEKGKVFGAFERIESEYALSQKGTGLGMPLTLKLAQVNGGSVDFESRSGNGSTFWVVLDAAEIKDEAAESLDVEHELGEKKLGRGEVVLIAQNDQDSRQMIDSYLASQGYSVMSSDTGLEVLKCLKSGDAKLLIVGQEISDMSGEELVKLVRGGSKRDKLPIMMLTSGAFTFEIERLLRMGVDRCLISPVELQELGRNVRSLLDE